MSIIEALQKNKMAFGLMETEEFTNEEMRVKAEEIGIRHLSLYTTNIDGEYQFLDWCARQHGSFRANETYQLPDHYQEKPRIVECEVIIINGILGCKRSCGTNMRIQGDMTCLSDVVCFPDFIGFEWDGILWGRLYKCKDTGEILTRIRKDRLHLYEVCDMANAHVLFKGDK